MRKYKDPIKINPEKGYLDMTNIIMLVPKTQEIKDYIVENFEVTERDIPTLNYDDNFGVGRYSVEILKLVNGLLKNTEFEWIEIGSAKDYPITLETEEVKIIVAPRVSK